MNSTNEFILARLRLAQQLLEESDKLIGRDGYDFESEQWWLHPRHEREALVVYLLLTCFDFLGQKHQDNEFIPFTGWLNSKKEKHKAEKLTVIHAYSASDPVVIAEKLNEKYQFLYGVKNSFYQGINGLPEEVKKRFLSSVDVVLVPDFGKYGPDVSPPSHPINNEPKELDLKLKFLYNMRNRFTHKLEQHHRSSAPGMSRFENQSCWMAYIGESRSKINYGVTHQEYVKINTGGAYAYSINDWPFILFETLYAAIDIPFDRTEIKLMFEVTVVSKDENNVDIYNNVTHEDLEKIYLRECAKIE